MKPIYKILLLILILVLTLITFGCRSTKTVKESKETNKEVKTDSVSEVETSKEIKDAIVVNVPKSDDEEVNRRLDAVLNQLNTSKTSGSNSYQSRYDPEQNKWFIDFMVGETQDKNVKTNSETTFEEKTDSYIEKKIRAIPWWVYVIATIYLLPSLIEKLAFIFNPMVGLIKKFKTKLH